MKDETVEPLDPALATLLASDRDVKPSGEALSRVWSRVAMAPLALGAGAHAASPAHGWLASHVAGVAAVAFVAGGGVGAMVHASLQKPAAPQIVYVERPARSVSVAPASPVPVPEAPAVETPAAHVTTAARASHPAPSASGSLSAERALLENARAELGAGGAAHALALLDEHAHGFPKAQLAEEREALRVQALVSLGRYDEARATAARLRAASPESLFLPAIEASLGSIP